MPSGTALKTADTPILPYSDSHVILKVILKRYLENCRFCFGIIIWTIRIIALSNHFSPMVLLNPMILNRILFSGILLLSHSMSHVATIYYLDISVVSLLEPCLFY